jgi:hypothetical protein
LQILGVVLGGGGKEEKAETKWNPVISAIKIQSQFRACQARKKYENEKKRMLESEFKRKKKEEEI